MSPSVGFFCWLLLARDYEELRAHASARSRRAPGGLCAGKKRQGSTCAQLFWDSSENHLDGPRRVAHGEPVSRSVKTRQLALILWL